MAYIDELFSLTEKVVAIAGSADFLCSGMATGVPLGYYMVAVMDVDEKDAKMLPARSSMTVVGPQP